MEPVAFPCGYLAEAKSVNASDPYNSVPAFFFCAAACHFSGELPISGTFPPKSAPLLTGSDQWSISGSGVPAENSKIDMAVDS